MVMVSCDEPWQTSRKDIWWQSRLPHVCRTSFRGHGDVECQCCSLLFKNHYHILLQTPDANVARVMRHIKGCLSATLIKHLKSYLHVDVIFIIKPVFWS